MICFIYIDFKTTIEKYNNQGCTQEFLVGGMKPSGARRIEGAKRPSYTRGVRGHAPPENFEKMKAVDAL